MSKRSSVPRDLMLDRVGFLRLARDPFWRRIARSLFAPTSNCEELCKINNHTHQIRTKFRWSQGDFFALFILPFFSVWAKFKPDHNSQQGAIVIQYFKSISTQIIFFWFSTHLNQWEVQFCRIKTACWTRPRFGSLKSKEYFHFNDKIYWV